MEHMLNIGPLGSLKTKQMYSTLSSNFKQLLH